MKKSWWIAVFVAGLSATAPVLAHDTDWRAAGALRGGNPDLDDNGWVGPHDRGRMRREAAREEWRREEARRHFAARARAKHRAYHRARAYEAAAEARHEAARAHAWR
jgi:hypothetical protein